MLRVHALMLRVQANVEVFLTSEVSRTVTLTLREFRYQSHNREMNLGLKAACALPWIADKLPGCSVD
jgi:hypothetical protein